MEVDSLSMHLWLPCAFEHVIIKNRSVSETYFHGHSNAWQLFADSSFIKTEIVSGLNGVGGVALILIVTIQWLAFSSLENAGADRSLWFHLRFRSHFFISLYLLGVEHLLWERG